jgi:hypothetical protein
MNKRIRELAEQAGYPDYMTYGQDLVLERFAELIVRECIRVVDKDDGATHVRELLEEHFEVENA